ncbi:MAG: DUF420 domain-containing protein [Saprospiraceae bacterium]|nr:DUF420 domain-containing protein [Saprospiraceae bacterium]
MKKFTDSDIRKYDLFAYIASVIVFLLIVFMRKIHFESSIDFRILPAIYSSLNAIAAILLILAYRAIKNKNVELHRRLMTTAIVISTVFLMMYVLYHITNSDTKFCRQDSIVRLIYFFILITHIVLAAISFPFIIFTFIRGYTEQFERHKKLAYWVFPVWLYVCITGPICYLMLFPCYEINK